MTAPPGPRHPSRRELLRLRDGPHEFLRQVAQDHGPVAMYPVGPLRFFLITSPDDVQRVLVTNQGNYSKDTFQYRLLRASLSPRISSKCERSIKFFTYIDIERFLTRT